MIRVKHIQIPGLPTKKPRRLYVCLPRDYARSERRYPVLYMFDGHNVFYDSHATYGKSWGMKEYLRKSGLPIIVVAVECNPEGNRRLNEYAPFDFDYDGMDHMEGLGKATMDWFTGPLKEQIDREYRTLPDRANTLIAGSSFGGLITLYAVTAYNKFYGGAAAISPSIWAGGWDLRALMAETPLRSPTRVYLDLGTGELPPGDRAPLAELFEAAAALSSAGAEVAARVVPGAVHNEAAWEKRIPIFMDYLLRPADGSEEQLQGDGYYD